VATPLEVQGRKKGNISSRRLGLEIIAPFLGVSYGSARGRQRPRRSVAAM